MIKLLKRYAFAIIFAVGMLTWAAVDRYHQNHLENICTSFKGIYIPLGEDGVCVKQDGFIWHK